MKIPNTLKVLLHPVGRKYSLKAPQTSASWQEFSAHYVVINTNLYAKEKVKKQPFSFVLVFILPLCQTANKAKTESFDFVKGSSANEKFHA